MLLQIDRYVYIETSEIYRIRERKRHLVARLRDNYTFWTDADYEGDPLFHVSTTKLRTHVKFRNTEDVYVDMHPDKFMELLQEATGTVYSVDKSTFNNEHGE